MAGEAKTTHFMIGEATVMVGPMDQVFDLMPATHSLGLAKNLQIQVETGSAELTQGLENVPIYSQQNSFNPTGSCEVYEYTDRNLAYALGMDASGGAFDEDTAGSIYVTNNLAVDNTGGGNTITLRIGQGQAWTNSGGDWLILTQGEDAVFVAKTTDRTGTVLTLNKSLPAGYTWYAATTTVRRVRNLSSIGGQTNYVGLKTVVVKSTGKPIPIIFPKVRITKGFTLNVGTDFGNMPFEFKPYPLVPTDTLYSQFGPGEVFRVITT